MLRRKRWKLRHEGIHMSRLLVACAVCAAGCVTTYEGSADKAAARKEVVRGPQVALAYRIRAVDGDPEVKRRLEMQLAQYIKAFHALLHSESAGPPKALPSFSLLVHTDVDGWRRLIAEAKPDLSEPDLILLTGGREVHMLASRRGLVGLKRLHTRLHLHRFSDRLPAWLEEGLVEYYSRAVLQGGGFGKPFLGKEDVASVAAAGDVDMEGLLARPPSADLTEGERALALGLVWWLMRVRLKRDPTLRLRLFQRYFARVVSEGPGVSLCEVMGVDATRMKSEVIEWARRRISSHETGSGR